MQIGIDKTFNKPFEFIKQNINGDSDESDESDEN